MSSNDNPMTRVDKMREKRDIANVCITKILKRIEKYDSTLICVFEGNDAEYYGSRIDMYVSGLNRENLKCKGKDTVLLVRNKVKENLELRHAHILYFIDKDFDSTVSHDDLYCTPCYSIENLYVNKSSFERLLKDKLHINRIDDEDLFNNLIELFKKFEYEADHCLKELNAWLMKVIEDSKTDRSITLNLKNYKIDKFLKVQNFEVIKNYDKENLSNIFGIDYTVDRKKFEKSLKELESSNLDIVGRGKYRLEFYRQFLLDLLKEAGRGEGFFKDKKVKYSLQLSNDPLSELSPFAKTPDCLRQFLEKFKESKQEESKQVA